MSVSKVVTANFEEKKQTFLSTLYKSMLKHMTSWGSKLAVSCKKTLGSDNGWHRVWWVKWLVKNGCVCVDGHVVL